MASQWEPVWEFPTEPVGRAPWGASAPRAVCGQPAGQAEVLGMGVLLLEGGEQTRVRAISLTLGGRFM